MGSSSYQGKEWIIAFVQFSSQNTPIKKVLDIGVGQGTYFHLLNESNPGITWHGVEIFKPYIDKFNLNNVYNVIYHEDVRDFIPKDNYDLVIAGDVLEHMTKEEAQAVVNKLLKVCRWLIISIPIMKWEQDMINDNKYEIHIKDDWSHEEVIESFPNILYAFRGTQIGVYALHGALL